MEKGNNYPVKYAILELKERGGWEEDDLITRGFIVSKCFVLEDTIKYDENGNANRLYKVFFPYNSLETFKKNISEGFFVVGNMDTPSIEGCNQVETVFDFYDDALLLANQKNDKLHKNIYDVMMFINPYWNREYALMEEMFLDQIRICKKYESAILHELSDLKISSLESNPVLTRNKDIFN